MIEELAVLIAAVQSRATHDIKGIANLQERVLKLEHKLNEVYDMLTDLRVNQIMGATNGGSHKE